jgi:arylsulfatase
MLRPRLWLALLLAAIASRAVAGPAEPPTGPNIVFILADDVGWRDPAFMGSDFHETPHLDRLAGQGMTFTAAYANGANCAPTRAALLSGQYAPRTGVYTVGSPRRGRDEDRRLRPAPSRRTLPSAVVTLAETLGAAGYVTASVGKWHLGNDPNHGPRAQGFDVNVGGHALGHPTSYVSPYGNPELPDGPDGEHLTARLTDEAITFIEAHRDERFFLYLPYYAAHTPLQPEHERLAKYRDKAPGALHRHPRYAALLEGMDAGIGRVLDALDAHDLAGRTLVVFMSDNGGTRATTSMAPLRGSKGMFYEGGIRVPLVARWPGRIAAGATCDVPVIGLDWYPTLVEIAGAAPPDRTLDGTSLVPLLTGSGPIGRDALYWHFPAYLEARARKEDPWRTTPCGAVRSGDLKLIEFFEDGRLELYDLEADPGETTNLVAARPAAAAALHRDLRRWRRGINAAMPRPNDRPERPAQRPPNIVYILADDLGYAELGCYGQTRIRTPNVDRLAAEGIRFTQHYAGNAVCAPSRCGLMTGRHPGRAIIRNNRGKPVVGQEPLPAGTRTVATLLKERGYTTACIGKWGLGGPDTTGLPRLQGFDHFFGYLDQWNAHSHYPAYLWRNGKKVVLEANADGGRGAYSQDLFTREALAFIDDRAADEPFFLYLAYAVPHVSLHVPEESLREYAGAWPETPFEGGHYAGHATPRAAYAAMVSHMDRDVGRIMTRLAERGLDEHTIVLFASDNGPTYAGGADSGFFESAGGLRGLKGSLFEGGIRVPLVARWPGHVPPGAVSDHVCAMWDMLPTIVALAGGVPPDDVDGISIVPALHGREGGQPRHEALYWEIGRQQAVRAGDWKLVRRTDKKGRTRTMLFDLARDPAEARNLADERGEERDRLVGLARSMRTPSTLFPSVYDDGR